MTQAPLPGARAALIDANGVTAPAFYRFFAALERAQSASASAADIAALQAEIAAIQAEIDALPEGQDYPDLQVSAPLLLQGLLKNGFAKLALNQPGDSGTGALKGVTLDAWGRVIGTTDGTITGTAGRVTVTDGDAAAGPPTIDLAEVADTGGGSLLKIVRDAWGRITGTSTPTTTDLAEGANLYFTAARVLATVLAGLSTATNAVITAADSVLVALGKLQAQITANVTAIAGKLAKSANLSDVADATTAFANIGGVLQTARVSVFTASGSYTVPANVTSIWISACAGGGGGSGGGSTLSTDNQPGGGGGGGGAGQSILWNKYTVTPGQLIAITVGTAGVGASAGITGGAPGNSGTAGGSTVIGSLITLSGGGAGVRGNGSATFGSGQAGGVGQPSGGYGMDGLVGAFGGQGASCPFGGGGSAGRGGQGSGASGLSASGYGSGGGGGGADYLIGQNSTSTAGGNGSPGIVIILC